ncbi:hypothetical protein HN371_16305 [Candidatus Poribacteria bacterium]|jgi:hypothetical protein|nr:hypothetical protein [Candidatus Poribacteria bacterium]MBT5712670.1 hypothetical protein [Candidatus Poribacteria bacterium]MBT7097748.1 hypothetical protein [Candidatus Poribacteria bacterium]MBT7808252.1 hypothetical protein [Candidatus Poribacteria bacterium]
MPSSTLEIARDIVLAYIEKYPTGSSAYSANIDATMQRMRSDILGFLRELHSELTALESGTDASPIGLAADDAE